MSKFPSLAIEANTDRRTTSLGGALRSCRWAFLGIGVFTTVINILALSGSLFMMEVYNRVLPSRSLPTLAGLSLLLLFLLSVQGLLDLLRARMLVRIGQYLHDCCWERAFQCLISLPVKAGQAGTAQPLRDLEMVRSFLCGQGPAALFDLPWIPVYLILLCVLSIYLGLVALLGGAVVVAMTLLTEILTRRSLSAAVKSTAERDILADQARRNAEAIHALGMRARVAQRWRAADVHVLRQGRRASDVALGFSSASRTLRIMIQSGVLAVGAILVIRQQATGGFILASSILAARALAPIDLAIGQWRGFVAARQSWRRLSALFSVFGEVAAPLPLPAPVSQLLVEHLSVVPPGTQMLALYDVNFTLKARDVLGVVGPSASGKSSLARALTGIWPVGGAVRLDGAAIEHWSSEALGRHIGYLPQQIELLAGSIAENIARFDPAACAADVIKAARVAGVHDLVLSLPDGYDTRVGPGAPPLSGGQQQRIALARALYGDPFLTVLDEPNSSLDAAGDAALASAIESTRARGGIVVVISHRASIINATSHVLQLLGGRVHKFGERKEILSPARRVSASVHCVAAS